MILNLHPAKALFVKRFNGWMMHHALVMHYFTGDDEFLRLRSKVARLWWVAILGLVGGGLYIGGESLSGAFGKALVVAGGFSIILFLGFALASLVAPWYIMRNTQFFIIDHLRAEGIDAPLPRFWGNLANHGGDITEKAQIVGVRFLAFLAGGPKMIFQTQRFMNQVIAAKGLTNVDVPTAIEPTSIWSRLGRFGRGTAKPIPIEEPENAPDNPDASGLPADATEDEPKHAPLEVVIPNKPQETAQPEPPTFPDGAPPENQPIQDYPDRPMAWMNALTIGGLLVTAIFLTWQKAGEGYSGLAATNSRILMVYFGTATLVFATFSLRAAHRPANALRVLGTGFLATIASLAVSFAILASQGFEPWVDLTYFVAAGVGATTYGLLLSATPRGALGWHPAKLAVLVATAAITYAAYGVFTS